jgi:hypothetical protein
MSNASAMQRVHIKICAPIPVGHDVLIQFWEWDAGVFGSKYEVDATQPSIVDRTTGVTYGAPWNAMSFFGLEPTEDERFRKPRPGPRIEGTVRACALFTKNENHGDRITTVLTIEVRGGGGYR